MKCKVCGTVCVDKKCSKCAAGKPDYLDYAWSPFLSTKPLVESTIEDPANCHDDDAMELCDSPPGSPRNDWCSANAVERLCDKCNTKGCDLTCVQHPIGKIEKVPAQ